MTSTNAHSLVTNANWKNVNNWHWIEKDCTGWAHDRLKELFTGLPSARITSIDGDVSVNQRKGKVKQLFDLELSIDLGEGKTCRVAEFTADAQDPEELEIKGGSLNAQEKGEIKKKAFVLLEQFKAELHTTHGLPLLVEANNAANGPNCADGVATKTSIATTAPQATTTVPQTTSSPQSTNASQTAASSQAAALNDSISFNCPSTELYRFLTETPRIIAWSRSPPSGLPQLILPGASFSLFGGNIVGKFVELKAPSALLLEWKLKDWTAPSKVNLSIFPETEGSCRLELQQEGVPAGEVERIKDNWHAYYWTPIKRLIGQL